MGDDIYFESVNISYKTVNIFEEMYGSKKEEIINDLKKILKEKYNIDINGSTRENIHNPSIKYGNHANSIGDCSICEHEHRGEYSGTITPRTNRNN